MHYQPGDKMKHTNALSRNCITPSKVEEPANFMLRIMDYANWIISVQLTDLEVQEEIRTILEKPADNAKFQMIHQEYALYHNRVYKNTPRGLL